MSGFLNKLITRVVLLKVTGNLTSNSTNQVYKLLEQANKFKVQAVVVAINSGGGSLTQAKNISDALKKFAQSKSSPVYCLAEDACLSSANLLLTSGTKCYAHRMSLVGDLGYSWTSIGLQRFKEKFNVSQEYIYAGKHKIDFNPFDQLKPESKQWMQDHLYSKEHDLKVQVVRNRAHAFNYLKLTKQQIDQKLLSVGTIDPEEAVKLGYLDGLKTVDELLKEKYADSKILSGTTRDAKSWSLRGEPFNLLHE